MPSARFTYLKSRLGRRVVGLFVLCALLPLSVASFFLADEFNAQLTRNQQQDLDMAARGYGHALLGRLGSADDVLRVLTVARGATDDSVLQEVAKLSWIRTLRHGAPEQSPLALDESLRLAVERGESGLVAEVGTGQGRQIWLVRRLPSGAYLEAQLQPAWLWADADEYAGDARLMVADDRGTLTLGVDETDPD